MCTKLPNWGAEYSLKIGDTGFITMQTYLAGEHFYERNSEENKIVKFTNVYFKEFIKDNNQNEQIIL